MNRNLPFFAAPLLFVIGCSSGAEPTRGQDQEVRAAEVACQAAALDAATFIDVLGWGKVESEPLKVVSGTRNEVRAEEFVIKSTVSGFDYKIDLLHDLNSESCIVTKVSTGQSGGAIEGPATNIQCEKEAFAAAVHIDELGWGKVESEPLTLTTKKRNEQDKTEAFEIKSTVSGLIYKLRLRQAPRSEACVVTEVTT